MRIVGVDLAWGERRADGLAVIEISPRGEATLAETAHLMGDDALVTWVRGVVGDGPAFLALDGPIVCPNQTGARPVDRETHRVFGWAHAGCYPANLTRCPRPARLRRALEGQGFRADFQLGTPRQTTETTGEPIRRMLEVFPHPATVVLFRLRRILKYKKGASSSRGRELKRFQGLLAASLPRLVPPVAIGPAERSLLECDPVSLVGAARKRYEDLLDAIVCALVGWIHWRHGGKQTRILGDLETGFIVVPRGQADDAVCRRQEGSDREERRSHG